MIRAFKYIMDLCIFRSQYGTAYGNNNLFCLDVFLYFAVKLGDILFHGVKALLLENHRKFISSDPENRAVGKIFAQQSAGVFDQLISGSMPQCIVYDLKSVYITDYHRKLGNGIFFYPVIQIGFKNRIRMFISHSGQWIRVSHVAEISAVFLFILKLIMWQQSELYQQNDNEEKYHHQYADDHVAACGHVFLANLTDRLVDNTAAYQNRHIPIGTLYRNIAHRLFGTVRCKGYAALNTTDKVIFILLPNLLRNHFFHWFKKIIFSDIGTQLRFREVFSVG